MGEEEPANEVSKIDSDEKSLQENTLDEITEKKDLETDGGKVLENNGIKELKENIVKEIEDKQADSMEKVEESKKVDVVEEAKEDKKEDGVEEAKEDKKDGVEEVNKDMKEDGVGEVKEDKEVDGVEVKEGKEVDGVKEVKEDTEIDGVKEVKEDKELGGVSGVKEVEEDKEVDGVKKVEDKKGDELKEIEEDKKDDHISENDKMDEDTEVKETIEGKQENEKVQAEKPEVDAMEVEGGIQEEESDEKEKKDVAMEEDEDEDKDNIDKSKEEEKTEDSKGKKGSKKRGRGKIDGEKVKEKRKEPKKTEPRTPTIDRPVRERKSVERLVASIDKDATKEFHIEKGRGTPLKNIPNVAFKLSRRKTDDTFKLLHTILFGRRGKAVEIKSNILRFSGFVWRDNEEKQMIKVKEKLDKCNKEKLLEFCDVLDITINKATSRKEDIIAKLIDFLVAPHATTTVLLAEKEKPSKGTKRKRVVKWGSSRSGTTSRRSVKNRSCSGIESQRGQTIHEILKRKGRSSVLERLRQLGFRDSGSEITGCGSSESQKKNEDSTVVRRKSASDTDESEEDKKDEENEENENGVADKSEDETPEKSESEDKSDSGSESEDIKEKKKHSKTSSTKKESAKKSKIEKIAVPNKSRSPPKRAPKKPSFNLSKSDEDSDESPKVFSRKKKNEKGGKQKTSTPTKYASEEKTEKVTRGKGKKKEKSRPSDNQLRDAICEILKEVDFNTATFTDILKKLAKQFDMDLTPRKASIKFMIQEELTKLADEANDEDGEEDAEKDEAPSTGREVEA
ncbi:hypothetical protein JHK85_023764 [Glycine max]|nr:hypothetical protein JHK85_023764 [Glycine max]